MNRDIDEDINWGKLFLKVILIFVVILLVIWLISKFLLKGSNEEGNKTFEDNLNTMYNAAEKYFEDESKLPENGKHKTITLKEMIDEGIIDVLKDGKTVCSTKSSYAKVTNQDGKYTLKVLLTCGSDSDYISRVIKDNSKNKNSQEQTSEETTNSVVEQSSNSSSENNTSSNNSTSANENNYTETEKKVVTDYTTKEYKFCKIENEVYNTVIYLKNSDVVNGKQITYSVQLNNLKNISKVQIGRDSYFISKTYYESYKSNLDKNFTIIDGESAKEVVGDIKQFITASLKSSHFDYRLSDVYMKDNNYYVDITVTIKKSSSNYAMVDNTKINYVPVHFIVRYANLDNCIMDTFKNSSKYATYYVVVEK